MRFGTWVKFILLGLIWGSSFLWIKIAVNEIGPFTLVVFRVAFALLGIICILIIRKPAHPGWSSLWIYAILGAINVFIPFSLISWSEKTIPSGLAAILNSTVPLWTTIFATIFLRDDRLTWVRALGVLLGFAGVIVLVSGRLSGRFTLFQLSQMTMLLATANYAASNVFGRLKTKGHDPAIQTFYQYLFALIYILPAALLIESPIVIPAMPITWLALGWLGILGSAVATVIYFSLLHEIGPTRTSLSTYIFPVVGLLLGLIFLNEEAAWVELVGALMIINGIAVVNNLSNQQRRRI